MKIFCYLIFIYILTFPGSRVWAEQERYIPPPTAGAASLAPASPLIDELSLKETDIAQAIEIIAQKSGLNIITGQNVKGKISIFLKRVDAREALRIVLESSGFACVEEGGIIRVMTAEEFKLRYGYVFGQDQVSRLVKLHVMLPRDAVRILEEMKSVHGKVSANEDAGTVFMMDDRAKIKDMEALLAEIDVPVTTTVITLEHARAETLVAEVRRILTRSIGSVEADTQANTLKVTDTLARVARVRQAVQAADVRGRVMVIEAKLVHVVLDDAHPGGVDWSGIVEDYQRMRLPSGYDFLAEGDNGRALSFGMISNDDFPTLIEALDTVGLVQEYPLSTVTVSGDDQVSCVLRLDDPLLVMSVAPAVDADGSVKKEDPRPLEGVAMEFRVRPSFDVTGDIVMMVTPDNLRAAGKAAASSEHFHTLSAHEGYTAVIGGIMTSARVSAAHKIPLLGDLPLVGFAFRMNGLVRKEEFVVFLTARSVSLSQTLADEEAALPGGGE